MRKGFFLALTAFIAFCFLVGSCDLNNKEVLVDDPQYEKEADSTRFDLMDWRGDTVQVQLTTTADWQSSVSREGKGWCTLSKYEGHKGTDDFYVYVAENTENKRRSASIIITSGTKMLIYKFTQMAAGESYY